MTLQHLRFASGYGGDSLSCGAWVDQCVQPPPAGGLQFRVRLRAVPRLAECLALPRMQTVASLISAAERGDTLAVETLVTLKPDTGSGPEGIVSVKPPRTS